MRNYIRKQVCFISSFGGNMVLRSGYVSFFFSVSVRFRCVNYVNVSKELFAHADANFACR